jgi:hypothetical protein
VSDVRIKTALTALDNALQQILQEAGFSSHTIWPDASPQGGEFDFMRHHDVPTGRFEPNMAVSRANSPPNDVNEEDKWRESTAHSCPWRC